VNNGGCGKLPTAINLANRALAPKNAAIVTARRRPVGSGRWGSAGDNIGVPPPIV
jgi:hypothetical protein